MRTFVMGDIHGCYHALVQCLQRSGFNKKEDTLIQLGDVADGWPETLECVSELMTIKNLIPIHGNHDDWTLIWMDTGLAEQGHRGQGGQATIDSYSVHELPLVPDEHHDFFKSQIPYYKDDHDRLFVHAGIYPNMTLEEMNRNWQSQFWWTRNMWFKSLELEESGLSIGFKEQLDEIYIGHTSTTNWGKTTPMKAGNHPTIYNLDTGCGWNGKLTIMDIDTKEYWQSDLASELYPGVKGRE